MEDAVLLAQLVFDGAPGGGYSSAETEFCLDGGFAGVPA